jgi:hypothetical protein
LAQELSFVDLELGGVVWTAKAWAATCERDRLLLAGTRAERDVVGFSGGGCGLGGDGSSGPALAREPCALIKRIRPAGRLLVSGLDYWRRRVLESR